MMNVTIISLNVVGAGNIIEFCTEKGIPFARKLLPSDAFQKPLAEFPAILYIIALGAIRGSSSVWLERLPVTQEAASSSLVYPAKAQPPSKK